MLFQPIIENAIKHGFKDMNGEKKLEITFTKLHKTIVGTVIDNGIGIKKSIANDRGEEKHKSYGNKILIERIKIFNEIHKEKIKLEIEDLSKEPGTKVTLEIPIRSI